MFFVLWVLVHFLKKLKSDSLDTFRVWAETRTETLLLSNSGIRGRVPLPFFFVTLFAISWTSWALLLTTTKIGSTPGRKCWYARSEGNDPKTCLKQGRRRTWVLDDSASDKDYSIRPGYLKITGDFRVLAAETRQWRAKPVPLEGKGEQGQQVNSHTRLPVYSNSSVLAIVSKPSTLTWHGWPTLLRSGGSDISNNLVCIGQFSNHYL